MLTVHHLSKSFNLTTLFEDVTFSVNAGDRAALIGANGSGKTTLLRIVQRARLQLAVLVAQGCNFLLLDEPINHLDIPSREMFEQALLQFSGTTLAVVHDRYFIQRFATEVWWVENGGVRREII